jgi:hypothetical protein
MGLKGCSWYVKAPCAESLLTRLEDGSFRSAQRHCQHLLGKQYNVFAIVSAAARPQSHLDEQLVRQ